MKHGMRKHRVYNIWHCMLKRCHNPKNSAFRLYGKRGIKVCERWMTFENFLADMGLPPEGFTLERKNPQGHYEPSNCKWAGWLEQCNNKRVSVRYQYKGEGRTIADIARDMGMSWHTLNKRLKLLGWSMERALSEPKNKYERRAG